MACLHRRRGWNKTVLSGPRWRCEHNCRQDQTVLSCLCEPAISCKMETGSRRDKSHRNWVETTKLSRRQCEQAISERSSVVLYGWCCVTADDESDDDSDSDDDILIGCLRGDIVGIQYYQGMVRVLFVRRVLFTSFQQIDKLVVFLAGTAASLLSAMCLHGGG